MAVAGAFIVPHPPLILPDIGRGEERRIQKTIDSYREIAKEAAAMHPETVVILSPHSVMYRDYFHISPGTRAKGDFGLYGYPELQIGGIYDTEFAAELCGLAEEKNIAAGTEGERGRELDHATMIPLYFLNREMKDFKLVRIGLSGLPFEEHFRLGRCIAEAAGRLNRRIVVIASGDLSHCLLDSGPYEYTKEGPEYDRRVTEIMAGGELHRMLEFTEEFCGKAGECGHRAFCIMAGCLEGKTLRSRLLSYEGPFGVGYAVAAFQDAYVALARESLTCFLENGREMQEPELASFKVPEEMLKTRAGVFVSLKKDGELRGCIGTIQGVQKNVALEIIDNAVSAGIYDPRFPEVKREELPEIICTVDVLGTAESVSSLKELDVKRYGVIVSSGRRKGLLLPNLEGVDTVEQQIFIALKKAGIDWEEDYGLERFEVVRHY
ncbi:AmmeMemoRadiSam system protein A [Clostridium transplantifaecale]|uniref:AmmeMemoRadiSam system protein A n=1 Tax=Clostridium transplantifaecale TaxID=2479838 RepID=UPI000F630815|nr:AmmeMemoRadiSam system protein A [Clostridium transplantifaecale]